LAAAPLFVLLSFLFFPPYSVVKDRTEGKEEEKKNKGPPAIFLLEYTLNHFIRPECF
jgi:hypothetical protein